MGASRTFVCLGFAVMTILGGVSLTNNHEAESLAAQNLTATYVRVCINHRGIPDRRACHIPAVRIPSGPRLPSDN